MKRFRRFLFRLAVVLVALLVVAAGAIQVILWTDLPKNLVLGSIERQLQLRVTAASLRTGWMGHTTLRNVSLSLPLANDSFLTVDRLAIDHTNLLSLLLGRPVTVKSLEFDNLALVAKQDEAGRWNVQEVAESIKRLTGAKQADEQSPPKKPNSVALPTLTLTNGTVRLIDRGGQEAKIYPIDVRGRPDGSLVYRYDLNVGSDVRAAGPGPDPRFHLVGKVVPGGGWEHDLDLRVREIGPWLGPWLAKSSDATKALLNTATVTGHWRGEVNGDGVVGRLTLADKTNSDSAGFDPARAGLRVGEFTATGSVDLTIKGGTLTARPDGLNVTTGLAAAPDVRLRNGSITFDGAALRARDVLSAVTGGDVRLNGSYSLPDQAAELRADWDRLLAPEGPLTGFTQAGTLTATLRQSPDLNGPLQVHGTIQSTGTSADRGAWESIVTIAADSQSGQSLRWTMTADKLRLTEPPAKPSAGAATQPAAAVAAAARSYNLDGLTARLRLTPASLDLEELSVPGGTLTEGRPRGTLGARGSLDRLSGRWWGWLHGENWRVRPPADPSKPFPALAFTLDATGDRARVDVNELFVSNGNVHASLQAGVSLAASADGSRRLPVTASLLCGFPPFSLAQTKSGIPLRAGEFASHLTVSGDLCPTALTVKGDLDGKALAIRDHVLGDVMLKLEGKLAEEPENPKDSRSPGRLKVHLVTPAEMELFEGKWKIAGDATFGGPTAGADLVLTLDEMSLAAVNKFVSPPPSLEGTAQGEWVVTLPEFDVDAMVIEGRLAVADLKAGGFEADTLTAVQRTAGGVVRLDPVVLRHKPAPLVSARANAHAKPQATAKANGTGGANGKEASKEAGTVARAVRNHLEREGGEIRAMLEYNIHDPSRLHVEAYPAAWPARAGDFSTLLWGGAKLDVDLTAKAATGPVNLHALLAIDEDDLGDVTVAGRLEAGQGGPRLLLDQLSGDVLGGTVGGNGALSLSPARVLDSKLHLEWHDITAERVTALYEGLDGLAGRYSGTIDLAPTTDPHALGPALLMLRVNPVGARFRTIALGNMEVALYADSGMAAGSETRMPRFVLDQSTFNVADGVLSLWGRLAWHEAGGRQAPFFSAQADFERLELSQMVHAGAPEAKPMPGRVAGHLTLNGDLRQRAAWFGAGNLRLDQSNLANFSAISALYNVMSVQLNPNEPTGHGAAELRLQGDTLYIPLAHYFNRGTEAHGGGSLSNLWEGPDKIGLDFSVAGSVRPLKDLKLPFAGDADAILKVLQGNLASVAVGGTLRNPRVRPAAFSDMGADVRSFILGDVRSQTRGSAGQ